MNENFQLTCLLFDMDGTLLDTAPDLITALNVALLAENLSPVAYASIRPYISFGAAVMIEKSLIISAHNITQDNQIHKRLLAKMLAYYQENIAQQTQFFQGMVEVLKTLESSNIKWGIVTNKRKRFTEPLTQALKLNLRAACIISGDSTNNCKPHPAPLYTACKQAEVKPENCIYIGDCIHDIEAGNRAGMKTLAATYGYLRPGDNPDTWGANALINQPSDLIPWLSNKQWISKTASF